MPDTDAATRLRKRRGTTVAASGDPAPALLRRSTSSPTSSPASAPRCSCCRRPSCAMPCVARLERSAADHGGRHRWLSDAAAAAGAGQARLPALARAVPDGPRPGQRRRGRRALRRRAESRSATRCELIAVSGVPGETGHVPARRPVRHRLGRLRGQRPDRAHQPGRDRRLAALLGAGGRGAHRRAAVPLVAARERRPRRDRLAHGQAVARRLRAAQPGRRRGIARRMRRSRSSANRSTRGVQLEFDYLDSRGEHERRRVDPLRVESVDADWYLRGWCHLREAVRTFRLDRISDPQITDEPIEPPRRRRHLPDTLFEGSADDLEVTIEVASVGPAAARRLHPRRRASRTSATAASAPRAGLALPRPQAAHREHAGRRHRRRACRGRRVVAEWAARGCPLRRSRRHAVVVVARHLGALSLALLGDARAVRRAAVPQVWRSPTGDAGRADDDPGPAAPIARRPATDIAVLADSRSCGDARACAATHRRRRSRDAIRASPARKPHRRRCEQTFLVRDSGPPKAR